MEIQTLAKEGQKTVAVSAKGSLVIIEPFTLINPFTSNAQAYPKTKINLSPMRSDDNLIVRIYADLASGQVGTIHMDGIGEEIWEIAEIDLPAKLYHSEPALDKQGKQIIDDDGQSATRLMSDNLKACTLSVRLFGLGI